VGRIKIRLNGCRAVGVLLFLVAPESYLRPRG